MKKILNIIESSETGGAENVFLNLINNNPKKYKPYIGLLYRGWLYDEIIKAGYKPILFPSNGSFDYKLVYSLITFIKGHNIDIIHSHLFGISIYTSIAARLCGIPSITTIHGVGDIDSNDNFSKAKVAILSKFSSKIVFVSNSLLKNLSNNYKFSKKKTTVIYNGINLKKFDNKNAISLRGKFGFCKDDIIIGAVGDLRPPKGYDILIKAIMKLSPDIPNLKVLIAGSKTLLYPKLIDMINEYKLEKIFKFIGFYEEVQNIYKTIDIYILPSISEGFSLTTVEAMASGLPVIATKCGGPEEIITNNQDGLLVKVNDSDAIANGIRNLIKQPEFVQKISNNARISVENYFSIDTMMMNYMKLYDSVIKHNFKRNLK